MVYENSCDVYSVTMVLFKLDHCIRSPVIIYLLCNYFHVFDSFGINAKEPVLS